VDFPEGNRSCHAPFSGGPQKEATTKMKRLQQIIKHLAHQPDEDDDNNNDGHDGTTMMMMWMSTVMVMVMVTIC